jgi:hypothetical protein
MILSLRSPGSDMVLDSLRGNIYVADFFFFATCPGSMPDAHRKHLDTVQKYFIKDPNFRLVSFTLVIPRVTRYRRLREYAKRPRSQSRADGFSVVRPKRKCTNWPNESFHLIAKEVDSDGGPEACIHSEKLQTGQTLMSVIRGYYNGVDGERVVSIN